MSEAAVTDYRQRGLEAHGEECHVCGATEKIVVHHRNGSRADNSTENLLPLCEGCHAKVHSRHPDVAELVRELGHRPLPPERTQVSVSEWVAELLDERRERGERYDDVILRLLEAAGESPELPAAEGGDDCFVYQA